MRLMNNDETLHQNEKTVKRFFNVIEAFLTLPRMTVFLKLTNCSLRSQVLKVGLSLGFVVPVAHRFPGLGGQRHRLARLTGQSVKQFTPRSCSTHSISTRKASSCFPGLRCSALRNIAQPVSLGTKQSSLLHTPTRLLRKKPVEDRFFARPAPRLSNV